MYRTLYYRDCLALFAYQALFPINPTTKIKKNKKKKKNLQTDTVGNI